MRLVCSGDKGPGSTKRQIEYCPHASGASGASLSRKQSRTAQASHHSKVGEFGTHDGIEEGQKEGADAGLEDEEGGTDEITTGLCGTHGCILIRHHPGLCICPVPDRRAKTRVRREKELAAERERREEKAAAGKEYGAARAREPWRPEQKEREERARAKTTANERQRRAKVTEDLVRAEKATAAAAAVAASSVKVTKVHHKVKVTWSPKGVVGAPIAPSKALTEEMIRVSSDASSDAKAAGRNVAAADERKEGEAYAYDPIPRSVALTRAAGCLLRLRDATAHKPTLYHEVVQALHLRRSDALSAASLNDRVGRVLASCPLFHRELVSEHGTLASDCALVSATVLLHGARTMDEAGLAIWHREAAEAAAAGGAVAAAVALGLLAGGAAGEGPAVPSDTVRGWAVRIKALGVSSGRALRFTPPPPQPQQQHPLQQQLSSEAASSVADDLTEYSLRLGTRSRGRAGGCALSWRQPTLPPGAGDAAAAAAEASSWVGLYCSLDMRAHLDSVAPHLGGPHPGGTRFGGVEGSSAAVAPPPCCFARVQIPTAAAPTAAAAAAAAAARIPTGGSLEFGARLLSAAATAAAAACASTPAPPAWAVGSPTPLVFALHAHGRVVATSEPVVLRGGAASGVAGGTAGGATCGAAVRAIKVGRLAGAAFAVRPDDWMPLASAVATPATAAASSTSASAVTDSVEEEDGEGDKSNDDEEEAAEEAAEKEEEGAEKEELEEAMGAEELSRLLCPLIEISTPGDEPPYASLLKLGYAEIERWSDLDWGLTSDYDAAIGSGAVAGHELGRSGGSRRRPSFGSGGGESPKLWKGIRVTPTESSAAGSANSAWKAVRAETEDADPYGLGGNTKGSEGYGELTLGSMQRVSLLLSHLRRAVLHRLGCGVWAHAYDLSRSSSLVDVGSGYGKAILHLALATGMRSAVGIECVISRHEIAEHSLQEARLKLMLQPSLAGEMADLEVGGGDEGEGSERGTDHFANVHFQFGDATLGRSLDFTHVYAFDRVFSPTTMTALAAVSRIPPPHVPFFPGPSFLRVFFSPPCLSTLLAGADALSLLCLRLVPISL